MLVFVRAAVFAWVCLGISRVSRFARTGALSQRCDCANSCHGNGNRNGSKKLPGPMVRDVGGLLSRRVEHHHHLERGALVKLARVDGALGTHAHACACSYYRGGCAQRRATRVMAGAPFSMVARASSQRAPFHCARQLRDGRVCRCDVSSARRFSCACMSD